MATVKKEYPKIDPTEALYTLSSVKQFNPHDLYLRILIIFNFLSALNLKLLKCSLKHRNSSNVVPRNTGLALYGMKPSFNF